MRRAGNAARLACGHPMCDPGSAECQARNGPPVAELAAAADRLVDVEVRAGRPVYIDGGDLKTDDGKLRLIPVELLDQLVADAQAELDHALGSANRAAPGCSTATVAANWRRSRPGFARLITLTDRHDPEGSSPT